MTIEDLLTMRAGLASRDSPSHRWEGFFEPKRSADWVAHVLDLPMVDIPGSSFQYSNGVSHPLSAILAQATGRAPDTFAREALFDPLGIGDCKWEKNPQGLNIGCEGLWMRPRDLAKVGEMMRAEGIWQGTRVLFKEVVRALVAPRCKATLFDSFGYHWWVEPNYYVGAGNFGQFLFVAPQAELVAVFTGLLDFDDFLLPKTLFQQYILAADTLRPHGDGARAMRALQALVARAARPKPDFYWTAPEAGKICGDQFTRTIEPAFGLRIPQHARPMPLVGAHEVMSLKTTRGVVLQASVAPRETVGTSPVDVLIRHLGNQGGAPDAHVEARGELLLADERVVQTCTLAYTWQGTIPIQALVVVADVGRHVVSLAIHTAGPIAVVEPFAASLWFGNDPSTPV